MRKQSNGTGRRTRWSEGATVAICAASCGFIEGPLIRIAHRKFRYENPMEIGSDTLTAVSAEASSSLP